MRAIVAPLVEHDFPESRPDHHAKRDEDQEHVRVDDVDPFGHQHSCGDDIGTEQPAHEEQRVPREFALAEDEHHGIKLRAGLLGTQHVIAASSRRPHHRGRFP